MVSTTSHVLVAAAPAWGHNRPLLALTLNLLKQHAGLHVTYVVFPHFAQVVSQELTLYGVSEDCRDRLRVVPLGAGDVDNKEELASYPAFSQYIPKFLDDLFNPLDAHSQEAFEKPPLFALVDTLVHPFIKMIRYRARHLIVTGAFRVFVFCPLPVSFLYWTYGTRDQGCLGIVERVKRVEHVASSEAGSGRTLSEIQDEAWNESEGKLIDVPGAPAIYDYEMNPLIGSANTPVVFESVARHHTQLGWADGCITPTSPHLEPGARQKFEALYGKRCLQVGPQFPDKWWRRDGENFNSEEDKKIQSFLDQSLVTYGEKSVVYLSFGSAFAPTKRPDIIETLVESLLATSPPVPFLFATASSRDAITPRLRRLVEDSDGQGMICTFAPQMAVLGHSATGWFLTHAGSNSVSESVVNKVPMIFWPCTLDQPLIAAQLSMNMGLGFELIQVRTGPSIGKPTHCGITPAGTLEAIRAEFNETWERIRGEDGAKARERIEEMGDALKHSWESGETKQNMQELAKYIGF